MTTMTQGERLVPCPRCLRPTPWTPRPDQRDEEDSWGPFSTVPDYIRTPARISPPDSEGKTHLLVVRAPDKPPSYWPVELNCKECRREADQAAFRWNYLMDRIVPYFSSPNPALR